VDAAPLAASLVAVLALAAPLVAAGGRLRRVLRVPLPPSLRVPADLALGAAALAAGVLALGLAGALSRWPLAALVAALAAGGRWRPRPRIAGLAAPALGGLAALAVALRPPFFYDALVYHLALPWQALLEGRLTAHPENLFAAFPPLAQLVYAPLLAFGLDRAPALLHWVAFVAAGATVAALARDLGAPRALATLAGAALPLLPSHVLVAGFPAAEGWMLAPTLAACALLLRRRVHPAWPLLAGALAGIACAARVQALPWAAGVVLLAAARSRARRRAPALAAAGVVLGALPWWGKNLMLLGAPLAPLGWQREGVETLWRDGGVLLLSHHGAAALLAHARGALLPVAPWLAALALAAALAVGQRREARLRWALAAAAAGIAAWLALASLPRFLAVPAALLVAVAAAVRGGAGRIAAAAALLLAVALGGWSNAGLLVGLLHAAAQPGGAIVNDPAPAFAAAAALPSDARVLFVGETRGYGFPRRFVAPSQHDVSPLRELVERTAGAEAVGSALRAQGFTHLLLSRRELARLAPAYPVAPWLTDTGRARFAELVRLLGAPVVGVSGVEVYQLAGAGSSVPLTHSSVTCAAR
jgi:hypothetical protein